MTDPTILLVWSPELLRWVLQTDAAAQTLTNINPDVVMEAHHCNITLVRPTATTRV